MPWPAWSPGMAADLLAASAWVCTATEPGAATDPAALDGLVTEWLPATVPGTAAGALRQAARWEAGDRRDFDASDWWFRCRFHHGLEPAPWLLRLGGLATVADVWLNGLHLLHSENMYLAHELEIGDDQLGTENELAIRCAALAPLLAVRRPRPRWKTRLVAHQNLRWFRTTLLGRIPAWAGVAAPVGPWRSVTLESAPPLRVVQRRLSASCDGDDGLVEVVLRLRSDGSGGGGAGAAGLKVGVLRAGGAEARLAVRQEGTDLVAEGTLRVAGIERWWPHTHGAQRLYPVTATVGVHHLELGRVGFRTVEVDRSDDGFALVVNGVPIFCRGACWAPPDAVGLATSSADLRASLDLLRGANMNMVRITGTMTYESAAFFDLCDALGVLVWQDCMFANLDPPDDEAFLAGVEAELEQVFSGLQGRPAPAVISGGSEVEQQAAMLGLPRDRRAMPLFEKTIPALAARLLPGLPYIPNSPTGGDLPFAIDVGVAHYYGVGAYLRSPDDARRAGARFAAECLAFSIPPERETVTETFGVVDAAVHDERWKRLIPRDAASSWDFEDVRDHYVRLLFGVDPVLLRATSPELGLDLGRAAVADLMAGALTEWRRPGSLCAGALVLRWRDLWAGAGWGLIDSLGRPKAPWFALARLLQPVAVLITDEGLNGLRLHLVNDTAGDVPATIRVARYGESERHIEQAEHEVSLPARGGLELNADRLFQGFRDLAYAYRFGPPSHDVVAATLIGTDGAVISENVHLPHGQARAEADAGLAAEARPIGDGSWSLTITTRCFAQWVSIDVGGYRASDSWFHLVPGGVRTIALRSTGDGGPTGPPHGVVRAVNSRTGAAVVAVE